MTHSPVAAVVFDIGGVFVDWNPEYLYAKVIPDPEERRWFLSEVCTAEWNFAMDAGASVSEEVAKLSAERPEYADLINPWWDRWREMLGDEIPGTREIAETLRNAGTPIYALTNWNAQTWELGVAEFPFLAEVFDGIVVSGQEGVTKPNPRIFEILSARHNLEPSTTAFIDDSPKNVAAATTHGYQAHLFTNAPELETWLRELDVL